MEARVVDVSQVRAFFEAHPHPNVLQPLAHPELKRFIAIRDGDKVVATATLQRRPLGFDQLGGVLVDTARQGEGIGRILMDAIRAEAKHAGSKRIICGVYRRDPDVSPYYRAMGFRSLVGYIPGTTSMPPLGWLARGLAAVFRVEAGPDAIRVMARKP